MMFKHSRKAFASALRIVIVIVLVSVVMLSVAVHVSAAGKTLKLSVASNRPLYNAGNMVGLTVTASDFVGLQDGIDGFTFKVTYDATAFDYQFVVLSQTLTGGSSYSLSANDNNGVLTVLFYPDKQPLGYLTAGDLVKIAFKAKDTAPVKGHNFSISACEFADRNNATGNYDNVAVSFKAGSSPFVVNITSVVQKHPGNVDDDIDGVVGPVDVILLRRYLAGWPGVEIHLGNANVTNDFDGDGNPIVGPADVIRLRRYLAGWTGVVLE